MYADPIEYATSSLAGAEVATTSIAGTPEVPEALLVVCALNVSFISKASQRTETGNPIRHNPSRTSRFVISLASRLPV
jgi:hypothetical protein